MLAFLDALQTLLRDGVPCVAVTIVEAVGSVPQDAGSRMLVTEGGLHTGTVGGGKVELKALGEAQAMLAPGAPATRCVAWNLKRDVGMTCGGTLRLYFEAFNADPWRIVIFGAGHVANALTRLLVGLDCRITVYDPRPEWLARLPESPRLTAVHVEDLPAQVAAIPEGAFVLLMTMGHGTDRPILVELLRTRTFPYVGVIGSVAKAARLRKDVTEAGLPEALRSAFHCPMGLPFGTNEPAEIALSIAAQLVQERDRLRPVPPTATRLDEAAP